MAVLIYALKPLKSSCLVQGMKHRTSCLLGQCSATEPIPNPVCSSLNKLCAVFLTLISGELALQISADCKNLTRQQPCKSWEGCSNYEKTLCITWGQRWGMWAGTCGHRGFTYDFIFRLAHTSSLPEDMTFYTSVA
jgi:hypothetical protein